MPHISARRVEAHAKVLASSLMCACSIADAQNLLANPRFDNGTAAPWQVVEPGVGLWNDLDYDGDDASGSVLLVNMSQSSQTRARGFIQCVVLDRPSHAFRLAFSGYSGSGQVSGTLGVAMYRSAPGDACGVSQVRFATALTTTTGGWQTVERIVRMSNDVDAGTKIAITLEAHKEASTGSFGGFIDNVVFESVGLFAGDFDLTAIPVEHALVVESH